MPLPREQYAFLSQAIYDPLTVGSALKSDTRTFTVRYVSPPSATNYRGVVVQDRATKQLVVVNKGTDPANVHDLVADLGMGMMGAPTQWPEAAHTMREALRIARTERIPTRDVSITGHSLGGALAQLQAAMPEAAGIQAETFNAYGARSMANSLGRIQRLDVESARHRVMNHRMHHDPVSVVSTHIGDTVHYMDHQDYRNHTPGTVAPFSETGAIAAAHGIGNFWDKDRNQPGAVFAHNYFPEFEKERERGPRRPLENLPPGVPLDLSAPWNMLGEHQQAPMSPEITRALAATAPDPNCAEQPGEKTQALYATLQDRVPDAGPKRLMQFTAACHENGITALNLDRMHLNEESMTIEFHGNSWLATPAVIDLTRQAPEPEQSMAQIRNVDQQQMQIAQHIAQSAQLSQQGPVR